MRRELSFEIITTVYNDSEEIKSFLDQIEAQTLAPKKVYIVDGGSSDKTQKIVAELSFSYQFEIELIICSTRKNIAEGFNIGIKASKEDIIFLTAVGNTLPINFCSNLLYYSEVYSDVEILYPQINGTNSSIVSILFNRFFLNKNQKSKFGPSNRGVCIRRQVFEKIGFFKENFFYAGEDTEFFLRCASMQISMRLCEETFVCWKVPLNIKQLHEKLKVNAIADLQMYSDYWLFIHHLLLIFLTILTITWIYFFPFTVFILLLFLVLVSVIRSIDLLSILFGVYCKLTTVYFLIRYIKFRRKAFKVSRLL